MSFELKQGDDMRWGHAMFRVMYCPYCGFTFRTGGTGKVWCGPHREEGRVSPAIQMREKKP